MEKDQIKGTDFGCRTDFLFSTPSFLSGVGSAINLFGDFYRFNGSENGETADRIAIECDFRMIGQDLRNAVDMIVQEKTKLLEQH